MYPPAIQSWAHPDIPGHWFLKCCQAQVGPAGGQLQTPEGQRGPSRCPPGTGQGVQRTSATTLPSAPGSYLPFRLTSCREGGGPHCTRCRIPGVSGRVFLAAFSLFIHVCALAVRQGGPCCPGPHPFSLSQQLPSQCALHPQPSEAQNTSISIYVTSSDQGPNWFPSGG